MTLRSSALVLILGLAVGCSGGSSGGGSASTSAGATGATNPFAGTTGPGSTGGTGGGTTGGGTTTPPAPRTPAVGTWYTGDLHSHSATHSDDARRQGGDPIGTTVRIAEHVGLDYLAGTDHRTNAVLTDPDFSSQSMVLLAGMEWGGSMHAGAIGQNAPIQESTTQSGAALISEINGIIADVDAKGGIFILNHPCDPGKLWAVDPVGFHAIEVWNSQWSLLSYEHAKPSDLDKKMNSLGLTQAGIAPNPHMVTALQETRGSWSLQSLALYESYLNAGYRIAAVGGGDRHMLFAQGSPTTHVYAASRDKQGILNGIKAGRTYITRTPVGPLVDFTADSDGDGVYEALIGDDVAQGQNARFRVVVEGADGGRVDVIKNGQVLYTEPVVGNTHILTLTDTPAQGDWYRVDVYEAIPASLQRNKGLILHAAQAAGQTWAVLLAVVNMVPSTALNTTLGTVLPVVFMPNGEDMLLNESLKDPGYCRGAITSAIYTR